MDEALARAVAEALRMVADEHRRASAFHRRAMERHHQAADLIYEALGTAGRAQPDGRAADRPGR